MGGLYVCGLQAFVHFPNHNPSSKDSPANGQSQPYKGVGAAHAILEAANTSGRQMSTGVFAKIPLQRL